jgi:hypothetical protein
MVVIGYKGFRVVKVDAVSSMIRILSYDFKRNSTYTPKNLSYLKKHIVV